jgi:hypothetical protein
MGLGWKGMAVANTLAYNITTKIKAIKSFIVQAPLQYLDYISREVLLKGKAQYS